MTTLHLTSLGGGLRVTRENTRITVISSEQRIFPSGRQNEAFKLVRQLLAKSVIDGEWLIAKGTDHGIISTRSDPVIECIRTMLDPSN